MSKLDAMRDWTRSDASANRTVVMNTSKVRSHTAVEIREKVEEKERRLDEAYAREKARIQREDDIAGAFTSIKRYVESEGVFVLDRCSFEDFHEFLSSLQR